MKIDLTDTELALLVQTVESSTYAGKLSQLVAAVLDKLRGSQVASSFKKAGPSDESEDE